MKVFKSFLSKAALNAPELHHASHGFISARVSGAFDVASISI